MIMQIKSEIPKTASRDR